MNLYLQAIVAFVLFAAGSTAGWQVRSWKAGADDKARLERQAKVEFRQREHIDAASSKHEETRAAAIVRERVVVQEVERVVQNVVYRNTCLDDDGLRIIAADIAARHPGGQPAPAMRAASAPD
jgi:hypothetical protein